MPFYIEKNDITTMRVDCIVNAANEHLLEGGGVCGAIFRAAGSSRLQEACNPLSPCPTGEAVITPGFNLPAKFIIHTPGPVWYGGTNNEETLLRNCYTHSLQLAYEKGLHSIAFPLISSGIYGYPKEEALRVATESIRSFLEDHEMEVYLLLFDQRAFKESQKRFADIEPYIQSHYIKPFEDLRHERLLKEYPFEDHAPSCPESSLPSMTVAQEEAVLPETVLLDNLDTILTRQKNETFSEAVLRLIDEKHFKKDSIVYKHANVDRSVFSKLRSNRDYAPSKSTALSLCIGLELSLKEARALLALAGYAFSSNSKTDIIVSYFIEHAHYDIYDINETLFSYGLPCLGQKS